MFESLESRRLLTHPVPVVGFGPEDVHVKVRVQDGIATARVTYVFPTSGWTVEPQFTAVNTGRDGMDTYAVNVNVVPPAGGGATVMIQRVFYYTIESHLSNHGGPLEAGPHGFAVGQGTTTFNSVVYYVPGVKFSAGVLSVTGGAGDDHLAFSKNGDELEVLETTGGQNTVLGSAPYKRVSRIVAYGLDGDDVIVVGPKHIPAYLLGGRGNDTLFGSAASDTLDGGRGDDLLTGGDGDDALFGGRGDGRDTLDGGYGRDTLAGGDGEDTRRLSVDDSDVYADRMDLTTQVGHDRLPAVIYPANVGTRVMRSEGRTFLRVSVVMADLGFDTTFGELASVDDFRHAVRLDMTSASVDSARLEMEHTGRRYYDVSSLVAGSHTLALVQASGTIKTVQFTV